MLTHQAHHHQQHGHEQQLYWRATQGKAPYAAGVQFPDVTVGGTKFHPDQANNFCIYPGIGLATCMAKPTRLTDACFIVAAQATPDQVDADLRAKGRLFRSQTNILETEVTTARHSARRLCAGARTCAAALGALQEASGSTVPTLRYTIPYAAGRIILAIFGIVILLLME